MSVAVDVRVNGYVLPHERHLWEEWGLGEGWGEVRWGANRAIGWCLWGATMTPKWCVLGGDGWVLVGWCRVV